MTAGLKYIRTKHHLTALDTFFFYIRGTDLMMHPELQIDVGFLGPLLSPKVERELLDT